MDINNTMGDLPTWVIIAAGVCLVGTGWFVWWVNKLPVDIPRDFDPKRKAFHDELYRKLREQEKGQDDEPK